MAGILWTDREKEILTTIANNGGTFSDATRILGRSRAGISSQIRGMGLTLSGPAPEINEEAFKQFMERR